MSERDSKNIIRQWDREIEAELRRDAARAREDGPWKAVRVACASCPDAGCTRGRHIYAGVPAHGHFTVYDAPRSPPSFKCR